MRTKWVIPCREIFCRSLKCFQNMFWGILKSCELLWNIEPVPIKYIWWSFLQKWFDWLPLSNFLVIWNFHAFDECQEMRRRETGYACPCRSYMLKKYHSSMGVLHVFQIVLMVPNCATFIVYVIFFVPR